MPRQRPKKRKIATVIKDDLLEQEEIVVKPPELSNMIKLREKTCTIK
jgi:hypothetical protein